MGFINFLNKFRFKRTADKMSNDTRPSTKLQCIVKRAYQRIKADLYLKSMSLSIMNDGISIKPDSKSVLKLLNTGTRSLAPLNNPHNVM